jgi:HEAT repeat protein/cyclophilin family peptidyl-prolyl cis-trans isomerase
VTRTSFALLFAVGASACATAPVAPPVIPGPSFEQKTTWILRLENQRVLHDPPLPAAAPPPPPPVQGRRTEAVAPPPVPPPVPDLVAMLTDSEARIRRRAALAIGRVGLAAGVPPLIPVLADPEPEVRQMAAFALGLIADKSAKDPLIALLADPSPLIKASAAEALGLIGDESAATALAQMAAEIAASGALAENPAPEADERRDTPAGAFREAVYAIVRLKSYDALATAVLDQAGQLKVKWWPVAYALQRLEDPRALPSLLTLLKEPVVETRAFAAKGLGSTKQRAAVDALIPLVAGTDQRVTVEAIRSLGRLADRAAAPALLKIVQAPKGNAQIRLEAATALATTAGDGVLDTLLDLLNDPSPQMRGAALRAIARLDPEGFVTVLSGLDPDPHWTVRAVLASVLGGLSPEAAVPRLTAMLDDSDQRVVPAVLAALVSVKAPEAAPALIAHLGADDPVVRAAAAKGLEQLKPADGVAALTEAYRFGDRDTTYVARAAALSAIAAYGAAAATPVLNTALADKDWAVRVHAATLLRQIDPATEAGMKIRPAPSVAPEAFALPHLGNPPVSTQAFIDTDRGTIQIEFAVIDAPLTIDNFIGLARQGFFNGVAFHRVVPDFVIQGGDPRGDGEGGPGYSIRDELNQRAYVRGTVGMALDWADTGGSQFFITHSPQPHLNAKYTVFGRVIAGMEVVDQIEAWDVIRRVRIWDGVTAQ